MESTKPFETPTGPGSTPGQPTEDAKDALRDAAEQAKSTIGDAAGQAKEKAADASQQARWKLRDQVDERTSDAASRASGTAKDLRSVGDQLRTQGNDQPAQLADQVADRVEQVGRYLESADADRLLHDLESFGRRQPWAVIAGGLAAGFLASRVLKASSGDRYSRGQTTSSTSAANGYVPPKPAYTPPTGTPQAPADTPGTGDAFTAETPAYAAGASQPGGAENRIAETDLGGPGLHQRREEGLGSDGAL